jgi:Zn-dependent peptidase ImmA (M78 family)
MKWIPDRTGRFAQRPHYEPAEIDGECETLITSFLRQRHGAVIFPVATNDLVVLLEQEANDVDIYADLSAEGPDVEGMTYFRPSGKPDVRIARHLAEAHWAVHRFRTTATHELGHVKLHNFLWLTEARQALLFPEDQPAPADVSPRCRRDSIQPLARTDWMEWQAGYACGAFLMPITALKQLVFQLRTKNRWSGTPTADSDAARQLITHVAQRFDVSADAARVRLTQLDLIVDQARQTEREVTPEGHAAEAVVPTSA